MAAAPIVFFYPSRVVGGVETLFTRLARALSERGREVFVVDYPDGVQAGWLAGSAVKMVPFEPDRAAPVPDGSIVVTSLSNYYRVLREIRFADATRLVLWSLHPDNATALLPPVPGPGALRPFVAPQDFLLARRTLRTLAARGAMLFMDGENREGTERHLRMRFPSPAMVPVVIPASRTVRSRTRADGPLRLGWLGRLAPDKSTMLIHLLGDLAADAARTGRRYELGVIGDGPARALVEARLPDPARVAVRLEGTVTGDALEEKIASFDLLFAMGTSALEGARLGVPTILADTTTLPVVPAGLRYRWLFEATDFSLGFSIHHPRGLPTRPHALADVLEAVESPANRDALGKRALSYFLENHELETRLDAFEGQLDRSTATKAQLVNAGVFEPGLVRRAGRLARQVVEFLR
jgi:glycosyltransferase involved in cell wall biosynthesis